MWLRDMVLTVGGALAQPLVSTIRPTGWTRPELPGDSMRADVLSLPLSTRSATVRL
jgi:hypothetical protein